MRTIHKLASQTSRGVSGKVYDLVLVSLGFEKRATNAVRCLAPTSRRRIAVAFNDRQELSFQENEAFFVEHGFETSYSDVSDASDIFQRSVNDVLLGRGGDDRTPIHVFVDVSSMSRQRIAALFAVLALVDASVAFEIDVAYSPAAFTAPSDHTEAIVRVGPVHPFFAGWSQDPQLPVAALIGLGYEPDRAVGAYEYLEASDLHLFIPTSGNVRYDAAVAMANGLLLKNAKPISRHVYDLRDPVSLFALLEASVYSMSNTSRPVIIPSGPKTFAVAAVLVGIFRPEVAVWQVSADQTSPPRPREAVGDPITFTVGLAPRLEVEDFDDEPDGTSQNADELTTR